MREKSNVDKNVIDIERINDARPADHPFHTVRIMIIYVMMATDGYDMRAIGFAALGIVSMLDIERPWLRPVLSANPVGMLFGAAPLASMGDRFGRCFAIAVCAVEEVGD